MYWMSREGGVLSLGLNLPLPSHHLLHSDIRSFAQEELLGRLLDQRYVQLCILFCLTFSLLPLKVFSRKFMFYVNQLKKAFVYIFA